MAVIRLGVIGAGVISQAVHLPAVRRLAADFSLTAVHDLSPARTAEVAGAYGARPVASAAEVIAADDVDAVLIATPGSHADLAGDALAAGKHVLAEKPLALSVADAEHVEALARDSGRVLQVGYMKMHDPAVGAAAEHRHELGSLELVRVTVLHPADAPQVAHVRMRQHADADPAVVEQAAAREAAATAVAIGAVPDEVAALYRGMLTASLVHELSILRALGLALPTAFSSVDVWPWPSRGAPPSLLAVAPLEGGARLLLSWCWLPDHPEYAEEVALFGSGGRLRLDMAPPYLLEERSTLRYERASDGRREELVVRAGRDSAFVSQLQGFARAVRGEEPVRSTAAGTVEDLRCLYGLVRTLGSSLGFAVGGEAAER